MSVFQMSNINIDMHTLDQCQPVSALLQLYEKRRVSHVICRYPSNQTCSSITHTEHTPGTSLKYFYYTQLKYFICSSKCFPRPHHRVPFCHEWSFGFIVHLDKLLVDHLVTYGLKSLAMVLSAVLHTPENLVGKMNLDQMVQIYRRI